MQARPYRGVPPAEQHAPWSRARPPSWESLQAFLEVVQRGSFRSAAQHLGQTANLLRRRVAELEQQLGVTLLTRHIDGVRATAEGAQVLAGARDMENAFFGMMRAKEIAVPSAAGEVKLAVTEGLGTFWLAPRLAQFQRTHPKLLVDLRCDMRPADMLRLEADVAVQLVRPRAADLKVVKLGRLHVIPYAAPSYLETYGVPKSIEELSKHRLVFQVAEQTAATEFYRQIFGDRPQPDLISIRTNSSSAHALAIASGAGIGWLVTYASAISGGLVPIDLEARCMYNIWLTYHADAGRIPRVRQVIDWLIESFDPRRFPWFRDEFVHPKAFPYVDRSEPLFNMNWHFAEDEVPSIEFSGFVVISGGR